MSTDTKPYRVLVTGWRNWPEDRRSEVENVLRKLTTESRLFGDPVVIVQGECPYGGADLYAKEWAESEREYGVSHESHPAEIVGGKIQGPARNQKMVDLGADLCVAFPGPGSRGTWDCLRRAADAGIQGLVFPMGVAR